MDSLPLFVQRNRLVIALLLELLMLLWVLLAYTSRIALSSTKGNVFGESLSGSSQPPPPPPPQVIKYPAENICAGCTQKNGPLITTAKTKFRVEMAPCTLLTRVILLILLFRHPPRQIFTLGSIRARWLVRKTEQPKT